MERFKKSGSLHIQSTSIFSAKDSIMTIGIDNDVAYTKNTLNGKILCTCKTFLKSKTAFFQKLYLHVQTNH